jgi:hypothetical protein
MPPFKYRGKGKVGQKAPLANHYKIHTCTQLVKIKKWNECGNWYNKECDWDIGHFTNF